MSVRLVQWDTADAYSSGVSEEIIGKAIKKYNIPRHKLIILTKCWAPVSEHENCNIVGLRHELYRSKDYINQQGKYRTLYAQNIRRD